MEYEEDLFLEIIRGEDSKTPLFSKVIQGRIRFNSWFCVEFDKAICFHKGNNYTIQATLSMGPKEYQIIPEAQVQESFKAAKWPIFKRVYVRNSFLKWECSKVSKKWDYVIAANNLKDCIFKSLYFLCSNQN